MKKIIVTLSLILAAQSLMSMRMEHEEAEPMVAYSLLSLASTLLPAFLALDSTQDATRHDTVVSYEALPHFQYFHHNDGRISVRYAFTPANDAPVAQITIACDARMRICNSITLHQTLLSTPITYSRDNRTQHIPADQVAIIQNGIKQILDFIMKKLFNVNT